MKNFLITAFEYLLRIVICVRSQDLRLYKEFMLVVLQGRAPPACSALRAFLHQLQPQPTLEGLSYEHR